MVSNLQVANVTDVQPNNRRVRGLDTIRFFLALWVVFGHFGFLPLAIDKNNVIGKIISGIYNNLFSGPAAVIVFFVISGFCIHYPFRHNQKLSLVPYFSRRHLRIWIPILAVNLIGSTVGIGLPVFQDSILWSLLAEEIYYLIYPLLLLLRNKIGWPKILLLSYVAAVLVILSNPTAGNYPSYGSYLNWILGLPCWLLGCCLAEKVDKLSSSSVRSTVHIWRWRLAAWFLSWLCSGLRFHSPVKYPWTLTLFAVFAFFWLGKEILHYQSHAPQPLFENAGKGSYSIYLVHILGPAIYTSLSLPVFTHSITWLMMMIFTFFLCYIFYLTVEKPSHFMAKKVGEQLSRKLSGSPV
jgi:peptidoglycan/LPS O-acetylase OafA/YrhL